MEYTLNNCPISWDQLISHVSELCRACVRVVNELEESHAAPNPKDMELLTHLGIAIHAALSEEDQTQRIAHDIVTTVNTR